MRLGERSLRNRKLYNFMFHSKQCAPCSNGKVCIHISASIASSLMASIRCKKSHRFENYRHTSDEWCGSEEGLLLIPNPIHVMIFRKKRELWKKWSTSDKNYKSRAFCCVALTTLQQFSAKKISPPIGIACIRRGKKEFIDGRENPLKFNFITLDSLAFRNNGSSIACLTSRAWIVPLATIEVSRSENLLERWENFF